MEYRSLGCTGLKVSALGFGASPLGDVFGAIDAREAERAVHCAIDQGINFFDVSPYYGRTLAETRLGAALGDSRQQVALATKCGRYGVDEFDFSAQRIRKSVEESLRRLRSDYVDLLQAHDVEFGDAAQLIEETLPTLRELQREGKARFVGITGYPLEFLKRVASAVRVDTILSYCRYNPLITDLDRILTPFAREKNIGLINASPLHMGMLAGGAPPVWHPAPDSVRIAGKRVADLLRSHGVEPAVAALRFCLDHPYVGSTLVGMSNREQVETNLKALEFQLDSALLERIRAAAGSAMDVTWRSGRIENSTQFEERV